MRYIADSSGYVKQVSFGADIACGDDTCTEYTGSVPSGYASLEDWFMSEVEKLYRWKIVSGNLTLDSAAVAPAEGWINCTLSSGVTVYSGETPQVRRIGNVVYLRGRVLVTWDGANAKPLIRLPDGYAPPRGFYVRAQGGGLSVAKVWVAAADHASNSHLVGLDYIVDPYRDTQTTSSVWIDLHTSWVAD